EGINMIAHSLQLKEGDEVIISKHEHVGGSAPWYALRGEGVTIKSIELDLSGKNNLQIIDESISSRTKVISISHVLCTTGLRLPVDEIAALCRRKNIFSCIDGAQALGMFPIDLEEINADFYVASGHKWLYGPKGTGILYISKDLIHDLIPPFTGAHSLRTFDLDDETLDYRETAERFEAGTQNTSHLLGLGSAVDFIQRVGFGKIENHRKELYDYMLKRLDKIKGISILSSRNMSTSTSIITFRPDHKDYQEFNKQLRKEFRCRCRAVHENNLNAIRVSLALYNSKEEIEKLTEGIEELAK
ncbi:MAG: aminotransferase class V-fold PLP-dependent enzyme, partial [Chitinophagales bacterium]|nr:aminotransferase class V-fold PLP-dependent enzyme [Chitinophagales bacterium]